MYLYDTLIFDVDGTLIDSGPGILKAAKETIDILGYDKLSDEFITSCIGPPIADSIGEKVGYTPQQIKDFYGVFRPIYKDKYLYDCTIYPGIEELLSDLHSAGVSLGIATNKREDYARILLDDIGLSIYFDDIQAMDMAGTINKEGMIRKCMANIASDGDNVAMVGDSSNDQISAKNCDIDFIAAMYGFGFKKCPPENCHLIYSAMDLHRLMGL